MTTVQRLLPQRLMAARTASGATAQLGKRGSSDGFDYVSGSTVQEHLGELTTPMCLGNVFCNIGYRDLIGPDGALGLEGPLGPNGPLGEHGPVDGQGDWRDRGGTPSWMADMLDRVINSADGPLGSMGPLELYDALDWMPPAGHELKAGGPFEVVGPLGPLGPLGLLGAAGPNGAKGLQVKDGSFVDAQGNVVRKMTVPQGGGQQKTYELFESYAEAQAKRMRDNDTSFMARGTAKVGQPDSYRFTSQADQWVTALVIPTADKVGGQYDELDLDILDGNGRVLATSNVKDMANWISIRVPAGTELQARVRVANKASPGADAPYRLLVTGSTEQFNTVDAGGPQVEQTP